MKVLFMCNTPYQIIVAIQLKNTKFVDDSVDLIISENIAGAKELYDNIKNNEIFNNVFLLKNTNKIKYRFNIKLSKIIMAKKMENFLKKSDIKIDNFNLYDVYLFANLGEHSNYIGRYLKVRNKNIKIEMFEDGFASYTDLYKNIMNKEKGNSKKNIIKRYLNPSALYYCEKYYLFHPQYLHWDPQCKVEKIEQIEKYKDTINLLNNVFGYNSSVDTYDKPIIFFEESYFADNVEINDMELVNEISKCVGKENIFVKIHPRNSINRFEENGYVTNKNTFIPWELIALNINLENKILITIASGSFITSYAITGIEPYKAYMLMDLKEVNNNKLTPSVNILREVCNTNKTKFKFPENKTTLFKSIKEDFNYLMKEKKGIIK